MNADATELVNQFMADRERLQREVAALTRRCEAAVEAFGWIAETEALETCQRLAREARAALESNDGGGNG